ncbi:alpha-glucosidase/alpha-galactosidase [Acetobacteraceae bacterium KSS8]|uniref:Alpha-glucosidase/alpha-galactosidase n=1 Tax=Endosaccharibacter trunci TaxID=2812733 RepID=A0ABT1W8X6_9PROT|nr:alpha-glucosidase/alpha-galactosidase [Acetobacteraceae bacterium KSS8]
MTSDGASSRAGPPRAAKIVFLGAGSTVFAKNLLGDILLEPALSTSRICLYDIDPERLRVSEVVANRIVQTLGVSATVEATTDLGRALDGASYAINMIQVGGYKPCTVTDFDIPNRYGLRQTIGDTLGVGGIMRALRTIPVLLQMTGEMERRCPDVLHLNYVNPMAMNCRALAEASRIRTVGLCHSVQGTAAELARAINVPMNEIDYLCAGINHVAFYLRFSRRGEDLYPLIRRVVAEGRVPAHDRVRYDVLSRLGYFVTESSEHFAEYVPWYIKRARPELIQRFAIPLDEYPRRCESQIADWTGLATTLQDPSHPLQVVRSNEYGAQIINARETGRPVVIYGNVPNDGLIDNLPADACVEVPCLIDGTGLHPVKIGRLPTQLAAVMQTNINVQALTVEAALTGKREAIYHAAMLDPHTAAELDLDQIKHLVDDMLHAHRPWLPDALFA